MNLTISRGEQVYINTVTFNYPNQLDYSRVKQMMLKRNELSYGMFNPFIYARERK